MLQSLLVVARCGNFTAASQQLFLSQSAVSRHIQQIEEYFGCALFVRHTRMVVPTAECQRLVPIVEELLATARRSMHIISTGGQTITLRVTPTLAARWLPEWTLSTGIFIPPIKKWGNPSTRARRNWQS